MEQDDGYLANRVECHEHNEDGWCYWLKPGWITPEGDTLICEETKAEAIAVLKSAYKWDAPARATKGKKKG